MKVYVYYLLILFTLPKEYHLHHSIKSVLEY